MLKIGICLCLIYLTSLEVAYGHPTEYKMNKEKVYEAELVPVSSTVIPLPIYHVGSNLKFPAQKEGNKDMKPVGPLTLITSSNKKAHYQKFKSDDVSTVKKV